MRNTANKFVQSVVTGILSAKTLVHVEHNQPVTAPLSHERRTMNYVRQNAGRSLTARQQRQIRRMKQRNGA